MPKNSWNDYSTTAASNTDVHSVSIAEGCPPSNINDSLRELMSDIANFDQGNVTLTSALAVASGGTGATSAAAARTALGTLSFGGDTFGADKVIGSNDTYSFSLETDGNTAMTISTAGEITKPLQPAFQVIPASDQTDISSGGYTDIDWGTERFDVGNNFASNQFTAPVTGKYQLNVEVRIDTLETDTADMYYQLYLWTSNAQYRLTYQTDDDVFDDDVGFWHMGISALADMDASDTAKVRVYQSDGTAQSDIATASTFSGYLVS